MMLLLCQSAVLQAGGADSGHSTLLVPRQLSGVQLLPCHVGWACRHWQDFRRSGCAQQTRSSHLQCTHCQPLCTGYYYYYTTTTTTTLLYSSELFSIH